jgi:NAD(P)-dependent dehydrogenase (short-subunit alcohol dehydrogenase family)
VLRAPRATGKTTAAFYEWPGHAVSPGSINTRCDNPEWYQGHLPNAAGVPLGRQGTVDEIAATCLFLVSEDAGFITGQTIQVNGGAHYY